MTRPSDAAIALKPCPFCGGRVELRGWDDIGYFVSCLTLDCYLFNMAKPERSRTVEAFNRRAIDAEAKDVAGETSKPLDDPALQKLFSDTIWGAIGFGSEGVNPPPTGHWLTVFWDIGRLTAKPVTNVDSRLRYWADAIERAQPYLRNGSIMKWCADTAAAMREDAETALQVAVILTEPAEPGGLYTWFVADLQEQKMPDGLRVYKTRDPIIPAPKVPAEPAAIASATTAVEGRS